MAKSCTTVIKAVTSDRTGREGFDVFLLLSFPLFRRTRYISEEGFLSAATTGHED